MYKGWLYWQKGVRDTPTGTQKTHRLLFTSQLQSIIIPITHPVLLLARILRIVLIEIIGVAFLIPAVSLAVCTTRAVPEVIRMTVHAV